MYNISLTKFHGSELAGFLKQMPLDKAGTVESLSLIQNSVKDLTDQNKAYIDALFEFQKKQVERIKPINEKLRELQFKRFATDPDSKAAQMLQEEINLRTAVGQEQLEEETKADKEVVEALGKEVLVFTLADDKFEKVKEMFNLLVENQNDPERKKVPLSMLMFRDGAVCAAIGDGLTAAEKV